MPPKRKYGKILPERKKLGMTQAKFAKALDVRPATANYAKLLKQIAAEPVFSL